jgi:hypothetical protein
MPALLDELWVGLIRAAFEAMPFTREKEYEEGIL